MSCQNGYDALENFHYFEDWNPGGKTAVSILYARNVMTPQTIEFMKKHDLRGARLWDLYKNVCNQDADVFVRTLKKLRDASDPTTIEAYSPIEERSVTILLYLNRFEST